MATAKSREALFETLGQYFARGETPTAAEWADLGQSFYSLVDDRLDAVEADDTTQALFAGIYTGTAPMPSLPPAPEGMQNNSAAQLLARVATDPRLLPDSSVSAQLLEVQQDVADVAADVATLQTDVAAVTGLGAQFRNLLINGDFRLWQRGVSFTATGYGPDRWRLERTGAALTVTRQAFALGQTDVAGAAHYCRAVVASTEGAGNYALLEQRVEGVATGSGQTVTVSFWVKGSAAGAVAVELSQVFGTGGSPSGTVRVAPAQVSVTTAWARVQVSIEVPSVAGKTLGTAGDDYLALALWLDAGSDFDARTDTLGHQGWTVEIARVQLEVGAAATAFELRPLTLETQLAERYYQVPQPITLRGTVGVNGAYLEQAVAWPVPMRAVPGVTTYNTADTSAANVTSSQFLQVTQKGLRWSLRLTTANVDGYYLNLGLRLSAEL